mmetsp:Transcript_28022/g.75720  ORF Transcript_28022/g.75720 Transcript_28022/m.75720 type:complete len:235 (-) Transcript_28022:1281-1985(-)
MRQLSARILNICTVVTSVHRPCEITSRHAPTEAERAVKAAAMEASPNLTIGICCISCLSSSSLRCDFSAAVSALAPLPLRWRAPPSAPPPMVSSSRREGGGGATSDVDTSATPTSDWRSAPTSLVPSPHMSVTTPRERSAPTASCFCSGAMRASTRTCGSSSANGPPPPLPPPPLPPVVPPVVPPAFLAPGLAPGLLRLSYSAAAWAKSASISRRMRRASGKSPTAHGALRAAV